MRCVGSSPQAAISALRNRVAALPDQLEAGVFDLDDDEAQADDLAPDWRIGETGALLELIAQAENLGPDPKLAALVKLLADLDNPVVFCRFIATAEAVGAALAKAFPKFRVEVVTGALTSEERRARVDAMATDERPRILVATDCLSEGINLQTLFAAVVHYDLSWNPTRHQQREGRVDRFGQPKGLVRSVTLFSPDSAIDGAVLQVILRKAAAIRKATGVTVTLPEDTAAVTGALMQAVLLRKGGGGARAQLSFDFGAFDADTDAVDAVWRNAEEGEKRSRARFAQRTLTPAEVLPEWRRWRALLGSADNLERFVARAFSRLGAPGEALPGRRLRVSLPALPSAVRERLEARGLSGCLDLAFAEPAPRGAVVVSRAHPVVAILSDSLLEAALDPVGAPIVPLGRAGAWISSGVHQATVVAVARLRFKIVVRAAGRETLLLAEEAATLAWRPGDDAPHLASAEAGVLLEAPAAGDLAEAARLRLLDQAIARLEAEPARAALAAHARARAAVLAEDHARLRAAARLPGETRVEAVLPLDLIGVFVLLPVISAKL